MAARAFVAITLALSVQGLAEEPATAQIAATQNRLIVRVLGPDLQPVPGAKVGTGVNLFENKQGHPPQTITMWLRGRRRAWPYISDDRGEICLTGDDAKQRQFYALFEARGWVGYLRMREAMVGGRADIHLEPACRVYGQVNSTGLESLGLSPLKTTALLYDSQDTPLMYFVSGRGKYEFLLPSGSYKIEFVAEGPDGVESQRLRRDLTIVRGQVAIDMGSVDVKATPLAALLGKSAPELLSVHGWKRGEPVQLSDLKGRVVVLVFWASWSEACLKTMPRLIELYDLYRDQGLAIVAVHDNSVNTGRELEAALAEARQQYWGRRELPFCVGLDSGPGRGAAHEAYGVEEWPTTIVIDRAGQIAGVFHPWGELQRALPEFLDAASQSSAYARDTESPASR